MTFYLLNSIVVPLQERPGAVLFFDIPIATAKELVLDALKKGELYSAIGHKAIVDYLNNRNLFGVKVEYNREPVYLKPGDKALVFKLKGRLPEGVVVQENDIDKIGFDLSFYIVLPHDITKKVMKYARKRFPYLSDLIRINEVLK